MNEHDLFLDTLSKDDREALLNKKMEEIRRKNEALQRRHAEIEADKKAAEMKGIAVSLKPPPPDQEEAPPAMRGVRVAVESTTSKPSRYSSGRGKRMQPTKEDSPRVQEEDKLRNNTKETRTQRRPLSDVIDAVPPEGPRNFLSDNTRQGPLPDGKVQKSSRNPRNFGGNDFLNVKQQMQQERQKHRFDAPPSSKEEMEARMTGRERREYVSWKQEREKIDKDRLERQKVSQGWKREWDIDKKEVTPPTPPVSRKLEPGKRPAGRIGSGRFGLTDERNKGRDKSPTKGGPGTGRAGFHHPGDIVVIDTNDQKHNTGQRSPRSNDNKYIPHHRDHLSSEGSDDPRQVQEENDTLVIQVVNDFSGSGLDGRGRGKHGGGYRGRGGRSDWSVGRGRGGYRGNRGDYRGGSGRGDYRGNEYRGGRGSRGDYTDYRGGRGGYGRGEFKGRGEFRGSSRGEYRGRGYNDQGFRGRGGGRDNYRDGYQADGEGIRGATRGGSNRGRGSRSSVGRRGGRGHRFDQEEHEPAILGTVVIDTTQSQVQTDSKKEKKPSPTPVRQSNTIDPPLSQQSDASGSWATTDSQDGWETEEEEIEKGADDYEDQYEEDDYWEEGLELQTTDEVGDYSIGDNAEMLSGEVKPSTDVGNDQDDVHNSSSESLERFIQEHTLHLNIKTGNLETAKAEICTPPNLTPPPSGEIVSPYSPLKTPEGHVHVLDWAADASSSVDNSSPKNVDLSMDTSLSNSEHNESLEQKSDTSPQKIELEQSNEEQSAPGDQTNESEQLCEKHETTESATINDVVPKCKEVPKQDTPSQNLNNDIAEENSSPQNTDEILIHSGEKETIYKDEWIKTIQSKEDDIDELVKVPFCDRHEALAEATTDNTVDEKTRQSDNLTSGRCNVEPSTITDNPINQQLNNAIPAISNVEPLIDVDNSITAQVTQVSPEEISHTDTKPTSSEVTSINQS